MDKWSFRYEYDEKGRTVLKKAPGAKSLRMLYDERDRVVFMQDGNQSAKSPAEWTVNLYDELDRPIIKLLYRTSKTVSDLEQDIANANRIGNVSVTNPSRVIEHLVVPIRETEVIKYEAQKDIIFEEGFETPTNDNGFLAEINPTGTAGGSTIDASVCINPIRPITDMNDPVKCTVLKYFFYDDYLHDKNQQK